MGILSRFQAISEADKTRAVRQLVENATPDFDFFFLIVLAVLMATFGLLAGSETIVVGSMLIAPILHPILGISLGLSMSDHKLINRSLMTIGKAMLFSVGAAVAATLFFAFGSSQSGMTETILLRTSPSLMFLAVAMISGLAVTYALVKPKLSEALPGVAVSVALIPPLAVIGIGFAQFDLFLITGASMMFLVNVLGIVSTSMIAFSLMSVHGNKHIADSTMKREEKRVEKEEEEVRAVSEGEAVVSQ